MNKEHFNKLVTNYSELGTQFKDLEKLVNEFPYSQPVRMLNVKSSSTLSNTKFRERLAVAAFYTTDRTVLRQLIEKGKVPGDLQQKKQVSLKSTKPPTTVLAAKPLVKQQVKKTAPKKVVTAPAQGIEKIDATKLRADVLANLHLLIEQKNKFFKLADLEHTPPRPTKPTAQSNPPPQKAITQKQEPHVKESQPPVAVKEEASTIKKPRSTKKDLIDRFIADKPRIKPGNALTDNQSDLSRSSSELKEDLVSENLAVIFAKQGKTGKAIDIYKKLIWKFPQKKASFAARIEELQKTNK